INGRTKITLAEGELLLLGQHTTHEIFPAGENDIGVNFIVLPEFFDQIVAMMDEENVLRDFLILTLRQKSGAADYFHFQSADILPVQNLAENLIWSLMNSQPNRRNINQTTMGLLFLHLMNNTEQINKNDPARYEQNLTFTVLKYIENHYRTASLTEIAKLLKIPPYCISKTVKKQAGYTFKQLLQTKRLNQSAFLLSSTSLPVEDIIALAGYDNTSYFHKIFKERYNMTPRAYRLAAAETRS
ncbi:MAG TPA: AraC family transcriptional regulator, partial [Lachnospiraceae bacterium]|nr:AraC family transcriptional regulator [Lachnospiraceae bacterium]